LVVAELTTVRFFVDAGEDPTRVGVVVGTEEEEEEEDREVNPRAAVDPLDGVVGAPDAGKLPLPGRTLTDFGVTMDNVDARVKLARESAFMEERIKGGAKATIIKV